LLANGREGIHEFRGGMGGGGLKYPLPPMKFLLKATLPPPKMAFLKKFLTFLAKKCHFSEIFWDLSGLSQIYNKIFKNFMTPPPP
jgi:hypothetical protein